MEEETLITCSSTEINFGEDENEVSKIADEVGKNVEEKVEEPKVDMIFASIDDLIGYYRRYGNQMGFAVSKRSSKKDLNGVQKYITIACSRYGSSKCTTKNVLKPYPITKTKCEARITAMLVMDGKWVVTKVLLNHNHVLSPGIRMSKSFQALAVEVGRYENLDFSEKDCRNYINKVRHLRFGEGDASAIQSYFMHAQATDSNFFYMLDLDDENRVKNLFWADGRQRAVYEEFGDVVTFDTTYLTNKYDLPFAPFVGVNHHGQSILFGCGLLSNEDTDTFTWMFKSWLACMSGRAPPAIITGQDRAMRDAIQIVFPNARHRWCLWHIMKKIPEKLSGYKQYEHIEFILENIVYNSLTLDEFETSWNKMIENFELQRNDWLNGLYIERYRWVPCFVKDCFWAGMSTTQRSESMNAFFDKYVNSKTTLKQFVDQYENALADKVKKENDADYICYNSWIPTVSRYAMEQQVQEVYTTIKFKEFQEELTGKMYCQVFNLNCHGTISEYEVSEDLLLGDSMTKGKFKVCLVKEGEECEIKCVCGLFEFRGILCRHAIAVLILEGIYFIPSKYILRRWRKDIKRRHTKVRVSYSDWSVTDEGRRYNQMCKAFFDIADIASEFQEKSDFVLEKLADLKICVTKNDGVCGSTSTQSTLNPKFTKLGKTKPQVSKTILTPLAVHRKWCPPYKRKQSRIDTIVQRKKMGKKNSLNMCSEQVADETGTQESTI